MTARSTTRLGGRNPWARPAPAFLRRLGLALAALSVMACDGRLVPATAPVNRVFDFTFDSDQGTSDFGTLTQSEILGELDLPDDAVVQSLYIERVRLTLSPGAGNEAATATLTFSYEAESFSEGLDITVASLDAEPVDALVASTLRAVESDLRAIISESPGAPGQITIRGDITNIAAAGSRLVLDASLEVRLTVTYVFCEDLGLGPFGPGADCITPDNPFIGN